jgi:hypothetical protein
VPTGVGHPRPSITARRGGRRVWPSRGQVPVCGDDCFRRQSGRPSRHAQRYRLGRDSTAHANGPETPPSPWLSERLARRNRCECSSSDSAAPRAPVSTPPPVGEAVVSAFAGDRLGRDRDLLLHPRPLAGSGFEARRWRRARMRGLWRCGLRSARRARSRMVVVADLHARDSRMAVIVEPRSAPSLNVIRLPCRSLVALGVKVHPDGDEVCADEFDKTRVALCSAVARAYLCESVVGVVLGL